MKRLASPLLFLALFLHALVPAGWMPGSLALGESAFIICTADGGITHGKAPAQPDQGAAHHDACLFAAAAHAAAPPPIVALAAPLVAAAALAPTRQAVALQTSSRFAPQAPRAPPVLI